MPKKPSLFVAACILSMIGSSLGLIVSILAALFFDVATRTIIRYTNVSATDQLNPLYFALLACVYGLILTGAIKLYRLQRSGLYIYLLAQTMLWFIPIIWLGWNSFSATNTIFTLLFTGVYVFYYKILKNYSCDKSAIVSR